MSKRSLIIDLTENFVRIRLDKLKEDSQREVESRLWFRLQATFEKKIAVPLWIRITMPIFEECRGAVDEEKPILHHT